VLEDVECVYHVAGVTRARDVQEYYDGNYVATKRIAEICATQASTLKRFVYISSQAAAGPSLDGVPVTERASYHPVSHYGKSKMMGELAVRRLEDRLPITIVRPSAVYGPRERDMYDYMKMVKAGIQLHIGFRPKYMNLIHVEDLVRGILLASDSPRAEGETYFLGSEHAYSTDELGATIARVVGSCPWRLHLPHAVVRTVGMLGELAGKALRKPVFFNREKARESVQASWSCSIEKAVEQLGFLPRLSLAEGMERTYEWYRQHGWM
jgi:dihydroflavonol-4-reductase